MLDGQTAPANFETHLALEAITFERLEYPYNDPGCQVVLPSQVLDSSCILQNDYKDFKHRFGYSYSTAACQSVCKQLSVLDKCGCADMRLMMPIEG